MYGCEVWETKRHARDSLEKTLLKFCKLVLGVPSSVTTDVVLGELNWCIPVVDKYTVLCSAVLDQVLCRGSIRGGYRNNESIKDDGKAQVQIMVHEDTCQYQ